jgi:hypothetical protein
MEYSLKVGDLVPLSKDNYTNINDNMAIQIGHFLEVNCNN